MPHFYFDLVIGGEFKDQGGMILEDTQIAFDKADCLASELSIARPELRSRDCAVRVIDAENKELYRTPLDPVPTPSADHDLQGATVFAIAQLVRSLTHPARTNISKADSVSEL